MFLLAHETLCGVCTKIIERNTTIPTTKKQVFSTAADNQPSVEIHVLQGERDMAQGNKTLGRFHLDGIPSAPRGVPQIEVTFDIYANGIVNVSAKDLGTGKEQKITITASGSLSKEDIDKAMADAERYAEEDKKQKEAIDTRNNAEALVYQTEKSLTELGVKVSEDEKTPVTEQLEVLKEALKSDNLENIKSASEELTKRFYAIAEKLYKDAAPQGDVGGEPQEGAHFENAQDADFKVVDEDDQPL